MTELLQDMARSDHRAEAASRKPAVAVESGLVKRNIVVAGNRTSLRLEPQVWDGLRSVSARERMTLSALCTLIDRQRPTAATLASAIRVFLLQYFEAAATEEGHLAAGHGQLGKSLARKGSPPVR